MNVSLRERTGEELLLMKVLFGEACWNEVDGELERRAAESPRSPLGLVRRLRQAAMPRPRLVA